VVELPERSEDLRFGDPRNHRRIKWAVGKAAREGVTVREAEDDRDLRRWYWLYLETMRRHGVPPRPYAFFEAMWETLAPGGHMRLLLAERTAPGHSVMLAGSIFVMAARTVSYAFNGSRHEHALLRANDLIQWQAIHDACNGGFRRYDMGEVTAHQEGLARFKAKWGATEQRLFRYRYPPRRHASADATAALAHRAATVAWRGLPKSVAVRLGDWLYRHA
jgi:lipid II:glycine glycyltransferase (peptidoglycan interpeptide bridge formation enzyme)